MSDREVTFLECKIAELKAEIERLKSEIKSYKSRDEHALDLIHAAIDLMDVEQFSQWAGVRLWLETSVDDYPLVFLSDESEVEDESI